MKNQQTTISLILGTAFAAALSSAPTVNAAENPFEVKSLSHGYMVADASTGGEKMKDGKCSTGKCGANKKKKMEEKMKEGSCSGDKKMKDGSCSADKKADTPADKK
jgi:uncharacterized low-complexity protein